MLKGQFDPPENVILMGKIEIWSVFWISPQIRDGNTRIVCVVLFLNLFIFIITIHVQTVDYQLVLTIASVQR